MDNTSAKAGKKERMRALPRESMGASELIAAVKAAQPGTFDAIDDAKAARLVREVFGQIAQHLGQSKEGALSVTGLGQFRVTERTVDKGGESKSKRTIAFVAKRSAAPGKADVRNEVRQARRANVTPEQQAQRKAERRARKAAA